MDGETQMPKNKWNWDEVKVLVKKRYKGETFGSIAKALSKERIDALHMDAEIKDFLNELNKIRKLESIQDLLKEVLKEFPEAEKAREDIEDCFVSPQRLSHLEKRPIVKKFAKTYEDALIEKEVQDTI